MTCGPTPLYSLSLGTEWPTIFGHRVLLFRLEPMRRALRMPQDPTADGLFMRVDFGVLQANNTASRFSTVFGIVRILSGLPHPCTRTYFAHTARNLLLRGKKSADRDLMMIQSSARGGWYSGPFPSLSGVLLDAVRK